jgi:hypothetical protein
VCVSSGAHSDTCVPVPMYTATRVCQLRCTQRHVCVSSDAHSDTCLSRCTQRHVCVSSDAHSDTCVSVPMHTATLVCQFRCTQRHVCVSSAAHSNTCVSVPLHTATFHNFNINSLEMSGRNLCVYSNTVTSRKSPTSRSLSNSLTHSTSRSTRHNVISCYKREN